MNQTISCWILSERLHSDLPPWLKRKFIGIEIDKEHYSNAVLRLSKFTVLTPQNGKVRLDGVDKQLWFTE
ncbi:MAG: hypothetical protein WB975_05310 [Nitrososphaeraceae archaeon]